VAQYWSETLAPFVREINTLCDLSYVYQQPLNGLLAGDVDQITVTVPLPLPVSTRPRQGLKRKRPIARDPATIVGLLHEVMSGLHPRITSIYKVADRLNMNVRDVYRLASYEAKVTSAELARRNSQARAQLASRRSTERDLAIQRVAKFFATKQSKVTRRNVHVEMAKCGVPVRWSESKDVLSTVRGLVASEVELSLG
jgi:hypothetical protein